MLRRRLALWIAACAYLGRADAFRQFNWYYDNRIHNSGNIGLGGKFHAFMAPLMSRTIDRVAYNSEDVRLRSACNSQPYVDEADGLEMLDIGCGVGFSTKALRKAYPMSSVTGMDCSVSMLKQCRPDVNVSFEKGFAHRTDYPDDAFDFVNCMFLFHEVPSHGRVELLEEIYRILKPGGYFNILDIKFDYQPTRAMLAGEPFLLDYLSNFADELAASDFMSVHKTDEDTIKQYEELFQKPQYDLNIRQH